MTSAIPIVVVAEALPGPGTVFLDVDWDATAPCLGSPITETVAATDVREDGPITELGTTVTRDDGTVDIEGTVVCYTIAVGSDP